jgi:hypothetical protein
MSGLDLDLGCLFRWGHSLPWWPSGVSRHFDDSVSTRCILLRSALSNKLLAQHLRSERVTRIKLDQ